MSKCHATYLTERLMDNRNSMLSHCPPNNLVCSVVSAYISGLHPLQRRRNNISKFTHWINTSVMTSMACAVMTELKLGEVTLNKCGFVDSPAYWRNHKKYIEENIFCKNLKVCLLQTWITKMYVNKNILKI